MQPSHILSRLHFGVLRQIEITERQVSISGRNSLLPRVYGKMQTEVSDKLAGDIIYMKTDQIAKGQVNLDEALIKKLVQI